MLLRYVVSIFLSALLFIVTGLLTGYLTLDLSAPQGRQLTASGALAYWDDDIYYYDDTYDDSWEYSETPTWEESYYQEPVYYYEEPIDLVSYYEEPVYDPWSNYVEPVVWSPVPTPVEYYWYDEYYYYDEPVYTYTVQSPWYVNSFPGIGSMAQQIIPGQASQVIVVQAPPPPPPKITYPQPSCWISAQPATVAYGKSSTLTWSAFNATRATLTDFGNVALSGSRLVSGLTNSRVYQLNVSGQGGAGSCYTRISVQPPIALP